MLLHADIHLGEAAVALARNVDYEVPFYRKQAAKAQQQLADLERRHAEHLRSAVLAAKQYRTASILSARPPSCWGLRDCHMALCVLQKMHLHLASEMKTCCGTGHRY